MPRKPKSISFHVLTCNDGNNGLALIRFQTLINKINAQTLLQRRHDFNATKFGLIGDIRSMNNGTNFEIRFIGAGHSYRPNLLDRVTVTERNNPKGLTEGDKDTTHIAVKYINNELVLIIENTLKGIAISQFIDYCNNYAALDNPVYQWEYNTVLNNDFLLNLDGLQRVSMAELVVDREILGGPALNYSNRTNTAQANVKLIVNAQRGLDISLAVRDFFAKLNGGQSNITRITVKGRNENNAPVQFNTDVTQKKESLRVEYDPLTGEIDSIDLFARMQNALDIFV